MPELSIIMPVYNELRTAEAAIEQVLATQLPATGVEVIVVDDGSTDGTRELLLGRAWPEHVRVLSHKGNRGKGAAMRTALAEAAGTYVTMMDADLEYDPASIALLLPPLRKGEADAVYGVRGFQAHSAYGFWYVMGGKLCNLVTNVVYDSWLSDITTGQIVMPTDRLRSLSLREPGFGIEAEITARLLRSGARIYEVPVVYKARRREEGKKLTARDGLRILWTLLRCRLR